MKNIIHLIFIALLTLTSCSSEIDLDKKKKIVLEFEQLPTDLKELYRTKHKTINDTTEYYIFSLDKNYTLTHY